jgi:hypothetical protein
VRIPHSQDYLNAISLTDYAPEVVDHEEALTRLLRADPLHVGEEKDLADDWYLLEVSPSERMLSGLANLHCAEYLLTKRMFFKGFYLHVHRRHPKAKARSGTCDECRIFSMSGADNSESRKKDHTNWLEEVMQCKPTQARKLVLGWRELGILNEKRFASLIKHGGMFENEDWGVDYN